MEYTLELSGELTDVIGIYLDGNTDGVSEWNINHISYRTYRLDSSTDCKYLSNINYTFDTEAVFNIMFDEV